MSATAQSDDDLGMIASEVRGHIRAIAVRVTDATYEDPFWMDRFGARGRQRSEEDAAYHVEYLVQALVARDAEIMRRYARWLQTLLTSRGMCTTHLDESFARVGAAIVAEVPRAQAIEGYVGAARAALVYPSGPAREVQGAAERVDRVLREHVVYLADALALEKPALFAAHVRFAKASNALDRVAGAISSDSRISGGAKRLAIEYVDGARALS